MSCSGFLIQGLALRLREEATSYMYVAVLHSNRTLLQRDVRTENELQLLSDSDKHRLEHAIFIHSQNFITINWQPATIISNDDPDNLLETEWKFVDIIDSASTWPSLRPPN